MNCMGHLGPHGLTESLPRADRTRSRCVAAKGRVAGIRHQHRRNHAPPPASVGGVRSADARRGASSGGLRWPGEHPRSRPRHHKAGTPPAGAGNEGGRPPLAREAAVTLHHQIRTEPKHWGAHDVCDNADHQATASRTRRRPPSEEDRPESAVEHPARRRDAPHADGAGRPPSPATGRTPSGLGRPEVTQGPVPHSEPARSAPRCFAGTRAFRETSKIL